MLSASQGWTLPAAHPHSACPHAPCPYAAHRAWATALYSLAGYPDPSYARHPLPGVPENQGDGHDSRCVSVCASRTRPRHTPCRTGTCDATARFGHHRCVELRTQLTGGITTPNPAESTPPVDGGERYRERGMARRELKASQGKLGDLHDAQVLRRSAHTSCARKVICPPETVSKTRRGWNGR